MARASGSRISSVQGRHGFPERHPVESPGQIEHQRAVVLCDGVRVPAQTGGGLAKIGLRAVGGLDGGPFLLQKGAFDIERIEAAHRPADQIGAGFAKRAAVHPEASAGEKIDPRPTGPPG